MRPMRQDLHSTLINSPDGTEGGTPSADAVEAWLVERLAALTKVPAGQIDVDQPFADYGLTSMAAVSLSGDLEEWLDRSLPPTLAWDFPNIAAVARYLSDPSALGAANGSADR